MVSKELSTHLTGRYYEIKIFPFSFIEFLNARDIEKNKLQDLSYLKNKLEEYQIKGGYPEIIVKNLDHIAYLKTLVESVIFKDIVRRYNIRFSSELYELGKYLFNTFSTELSLNRITKMLEIGSVHTVKRYLAYLEEAFLIVRIPRFSFKYNRHDYHKKLYILAIHYTFSLGGALKS